MMTIRARARNQYRPRCLEVVRVDVGQARGGNSVEPDPHQREIALGQRQLVECPRSGLHAFIFEQPANELRARIFHLFAGKRWRLGQEKPRFDFDQYRRHQQVFGGELELRLPHHFDVAQILTRELRHRNVENVDILLANEIQEQVQRTLEGFEENLERFRRNVQIVRHLQQRLAVDARDRCPRRLRKIDDRCHRGGLAHV